MKTSIERSEMAVRFGRVFTLKFFMMILLLIFFFNVGRLFGPCDKDKKDSSFETLDDRMSRHKPYPDNIQDEFIDDELPYHPEKYSEILRPDFPSEIEVLGPSSDEKIEVYPPRLKRKPIPPKVTPKPKTPSPPRQPSTKPTSKPLQQNLYVAKDLYGTGTVLHHKELKRKGLESTSKHTFKSPYIRDPHVYIPSIVRKAPGYRKTKIISCFNCPERFYLAQKYNNDFKACPYQECQLTKTGGFNPNASVMIFWQDPMTTPPPKPRGQAWVYMSWETPPHRGHPNPDSAWFDLFNWTISYRSDADFQLPYDTMSWRDSDLLMSDDFYLKMAKMKTKTAAWWVSHCKTRAHREHYVRELKKYIDVDVMGTCNNKTCDRKYNADCYSALNETYKFYLSFENSHCEDYVTEKFFKVFRFRYNVIPVARGSFNYGKYLPPNILVDAGKFNSAKDLAFHLKYLGNDHERYAKMLKEKDRLTIHNRKMDWCDFCEKLHTGKFKSRVIHNVREFTNEGKPCWDSLIKDGTDPFLDM